VPGYTRHGSPQAAFGQHESDLHNSEGFGLYVLVSDSKGNRVTRYGGQAALSAFEHGEGMTLDQIEATIDALDG